MSLSATIAAVVLSIGPAASPTPSPPCTALQYSFTSDCFREPGDAGCVWHPEKPDLGPQIAVWVERADDAGFVDTLMLTNATALFGIGNRPGEWDVRSGPRFPYGRRPTALPVWAHTRGKTYPMVVMQNGDEQNLGRHEDQSSPEPHFCRPMLLSEVVDAITCPSGTFRSDKGRLDASSVSFYPPRADIFDSGASCPPIVNHMGSCDYGDSGEYAFLNDVDTVAAATPPFGVETRKEWIIPSDLAPGGYALMVEVGKEFDTNAAYREANAPAVDVPDYGVDGNLGQPSVIFRVPFTIGGASAGWAATAPSLYGYGDATGASGTIFAPDGSISSTPGSGEGRLATTEGPGGAGRVHVSFSACEAFDCGSNGAPDPVPIEDLPVDLTATTAVIRIHQVGDGDLPVLGYEARVTSVEQHGYFDITMQDFSRWTPLPGFDPGAPDTVSDLDATGLIPDTEYAVGVVARGRCGSSAVSYARFRTPVLKFQQLRGCFIATAAFGSELAGEVKALRLVRDRAVGASALVAVAAELYYRSGPAAARVLAETDVGRALVRRPLRPIAAVATAIAQALARR